MPRNPRKPGLTALELRIMQVIWTCGASTVAAVQAELSPPLAYTTVQTMLNILTRKGKLSRRLQGRAYVYSPRVSQARALGQGVRDLIDRMFQGSSEALVMSLLHNRQIEPEKLAELMRRFSRQSRPIAEDEGKKP